MTTPTNEAGHGLLCRLYADAYHAGHHDTVEGCYIDVLPVDRDTYWADKVVESDAALALSRGVPDGCAAVAQQLRDELAHDQGWDYTEYEKGRIAEKRRCISLLEAATAAAGAQGVDWLAFSNELEAFKPRGELGALHGAGMAFAYKDVANTIRAKLATTTPQPAAADGGVREVSSAVSERQVLEWMKPIRAVMSTLHAEIGWYADEHTKPAEEALTAIEQALTQQPALSSHRQAGDDLSKFRELAERWRDETAGAKNYSLTEYEKGWAAKQKRDADEILILIDEVPK